MHLARFPRVHLAHLPTPLERMDRLSEALGGPEIWIKRDDCTGLSTGGNKTRKLEFLMAEAQAWGADLVMTQGRRNRTTPDKRQHSRPSLGWTAIFSLKIERDTKKRITTTTATYSWTFYMARVMKSDRRDWI